MSTYEQQKLVIFPDHFGEAPDDTLAQGMAAREAGIERLVDARTLVVTRFQTTIIGTLAARGTVTADDVAKAHPELLERVPNAMGAAFTGLARRKVIAVAGWTTSTRKRRHAGSQREWCRGPKWGEM